ncbi:VWA domain-containing protein [Vibrio sp. SS-MA-C1-2]|uniref:VWA domain-containing protein n=1 Tax=Vibrio sp. SS-MA-C1-2 TaxID=2908646 RepID=UPI001F175D4D|nr:VWA domain-containing protein [Vibrio sp. SS-MA-C1-2]UJF17082.1 VWA domain-containing protein [Vibrio sp. SS-MA-C1-2]
MISRWQGLEALLDKFAHQRTGDRLGLIAFGSGAYLQVPFTTKIDTWQMMLDSMDAEIAGPTTAIGDAIGL